VALPVASWIGVACVHVAGFQPRPSLPYTLVRADRVKVNTTEVRSHSLIHWLDTLLGELSVTWCAEFKQSAHCCPSASIIISESSSGGNIIRVLLGCWDCGQRAGAHSVQEVID
jgi:hypothetical protein